MTARCADDFEVGPDGKGVGCARCARGGGVLPRLPDVDLLTATGPAIDAVYATACAACSRWIDAGQRIRPTADGWAHAECTREQP